MKRKMMLCAFALAATMGFWMGAMALSPVLSDKTASSSAQAPAVTATTKEEACEKMANPGCKRLMAPSKTTEITFSDNEVPQVVIYRSQLR